MGARLKILLLAAALTVSPICAADIRPGEPASAAAMGFDFLMARPLGLASTIVGSGLFVLSLPFSALGMNVEEAGTRLVVEPAKFTFVRPLGEFDK